MASLRQIAFSSFWVGLLLASTSAGQEGAPSANNGEGLLLNAEEEAEFAELKAIFREEQVGPKPGGLPKWLWMGNASVQAGYDDNPLRSESPQGSALVQPQLDFILLWLPDDSFRGTLMTFYEGRYFRRSGMDPEHVTALYATGEWQGIYGKTRLSLDALYARQVYDATVLRESPDRVIGLMTQMRPKIRLRHEWSLSPDWYIEPSASTSLSDFREMDEDFWTYEGELRIGRGQSEKNRMEWYLGGGEDRYLDAPARGELGLAVPGTKLRIQYVTTGLKGVLLLDKSARWTVSLDVAVTFENDRRGVYFERWRYSLNPEIRWRKQALDIRARVGWRHTDYAERRLSLLSDPTEWNQRWSGSLEIHYQWSEVLSSQVRLEIFDLDSNRASIVYRQRQITAGASYHF